MARPKNESSESVTGSIPEVKKGKAPDAFPGESYSKTEPKGDEYSQREDDKPNNLKDAPSSGEYDAVDPTEIPEKKKGSKKEKAAKPDYIEFEDGHDEVKNKKEESEDEENEETEDDDNKSDEGSGASHAEDDDGLDEDLIGRALDAGMNEDDIADFDNNKEFKRYVRALEISNEKKSRGSKADEEIPAKKKTDDDTGKTDIEEFKLDLDKDIFEPKVVEALESLNKHYHKQIAAIAKKNEELELKLKEKEQKEIHKETQERELNTVREFDSVLKKLVSDKDNGSFWKKEFGEGDAFTVKKGTPEFKNRSNIYSEFLAFMEVDSKKGRKSSIESLIRKAINSQYEGQAVNIAKQELSEKLKKRTKLFTERATSKDPGDSGLTRKQIAIRNLKEKIERKRSGE